MRLTGTVGLAAKAAQQGITSSSCTLPDAFGPLVFISNREPSSALV